MNQRLALVALVVPDYDEAIEHYTRDLGFELVEDDDRGGGKRWVVVKPSGEGGCQLLLAQAANEAQRQAVGNQTGGRVFLFLHTDDFERDHQRLVDRGVTMTESPRHEAYGTVVVFQDRFGNKWDLIGPPADRSAGAGR